MTPKASDLLAVAVQYTFLSTTPPVSQGVIDDVARAAATVVLGIISKAAYELIEKWRAKRKTRKKGASNPHS